MFGGGRLEYQPADVDPDLHHGEEEGDEDAGGGAGAGRVRARGGEDPGDPVGLRHHGGVAEGVAEPYEEPHNATGELRRFVDDDEGGGEADEGPDDENTAELSTASPHHWSVPVFPQNS